MKASAAIALLSATLTAQQFRPSRFAPVPPIVASWPVQQIDVGDVDRDGFDDVVLALDYGGVAYLRADRHGGFVDMTTPTLTPSTASAYGAVLGDMDNDGDLDIAAVHDHSGVIQVWSNNGGTFVDVTATFSPVVALRPTGLAWIDIDGDARLDLFVLAYAPRLLHQQNGRLVDVTATHLGVGSYLNANHMEAVDIDADGDQDLALFAGTHSLLLNDGTGRFSPVSMTKFPATSVGLFGHGDFDGDRRPDLLVAAPAPALYLQSAAGSFVDVTATHLPAISSLIRMAASDVDLDGDLDLCGPNLLLVNDGSGRFTDVTASRWTATLPRMSFVGAAFAFGDVDADGDPDFLVVDGATNQLVSLNHHRHVAAPVAPVRGARYDLEFSAAPGYAPVPAAALPWFGIASHHLHLSGFGHVGVDPASVVTGPAFPITAPAGVTTLSLMVPNSASLAGLTLYVQAIEIAGGRIRTTNTVRDRIR